MELGERLFGSAWVEEYSHGPGLTGVGICISPSQEIEGRTGIGAGNQAPLRAVPVLDQRLREAVGETKSYGPDVVCRDDGKSTQRAVVCTGAETLDRAPRGAVPVLDQRVSRGLSYRPDIACRDGLDIL